MPMRVKIDVARLFSLWNDESLTRAETDEASTKRAWWQRRA
jgi:hypothetical protein